MWLVILYVMHCGFYVISTRSVARKAVKRGHEDKHPYDDTVSSLLAPLCWFYSTPNLEKAWSFQIDVDRGIRRSCLSFS